LFLSPFSITLFAMESEPILRIENLEVGLGRNSGLRVVDRADLELHKGEILALVGESGSGKTVTALALLNLLAEPDLRIVSGRILFKGRDLRTLPPRDWQQVRGKQIAMVFQEPGAALNPVIRCGDQISEVLVWHERLNAATARLRTLELMQEVGLPDVDDLYRSYPHQLSGGMKQRIHLAMALACNPELLIADEPTSALDVTVEAQILQLIRRQQERRRLSVLLITHDFGVVGAVAERVAVMYASRIVEVGIVRQILKAPRHPYTLGLLQSIPRPEAGGALRTLPGQIPDLMNPPSGCYFHPRCAYATDRCRRERPPFEEVEPGHRTACFEHALLAPMAVSPA
jgi:peptide/nickel transport system ATP-binding protein